MTKSSVITNRLSITMAGLIIGYLFCSDQPALGNDLDVNLLMLSMLYKNF